MCRANAFHFEYSRYQNEQTYFEVIFVGALLIQCKTTAMQNLYGLHSRRFPDSHLTITADIQSFTLLVFVWNRHLNPKLLLQMIHFSLAA